uniref:Uncharacterized protein n=1 Tax=Vitis vinifera TaxID=29760 RepID=F6HAC0_VITVI
MIEYHVFQYKEPSYGRKIFITACR